jgi:hypothetical protein
MQIGQRGRKTGWEQPRNVKRDEDGYDNVEDYFYEEESSLRISLVCFLLFPRSYTSH